MGKFSVLDLASARLAKGSRSFNPSRSLRFKDSMQTSCQGDPGQTKGVLGPLPESHSFTVRATVYGANVGTDVLGYRCTIIQTARTRGKAVNIGDE
jgi:hypothetical protein